MNISAFFPTLFSGCQSHLHFLSSNQLVFPLGMFVPPLFHSTYPRYEKNTLKEHFLFRYKAAHWIYPYIWSMYNVEYLPERCITVPRDSLLLKISSTWSCRTVRKLRWSPYSNSASVVQSLTAEIPNCSLPSQCDRPRSGGVCLDSLPGCDRKRGTWWTSLSLGGAGAGGVVAVFCTADSAAGQWPSSHVRLGTQSVLIHSLSSGLWPKS